MANWSERAEHYRVQVTSEGIRATRGYRRAGDGALADADLPTLNQTPFTKDDGTVLDECLAVSYIEKYATPRQGNDDFVDLIYTFETPNMSGEDGEGNLSDSAALNSLEIRIGTETVSIPDPSGSFDYYDGAASYEPVTAALEWNIITGTILRPEFGTELVNLGTKLSTEVLPNVNKISSAASGNGSGTLLGFRQGSLRYIGCTVTAYFDPETSLYYAKLLHETQYRYIDNADVTLDDWNYELNEQTGTWQKVVDKTVDRNPRYASADLTALVQPS